MTLGRKQQIDRADYALLNAVALDEWAAYLLMADVPMEDVMNAPSHGLREQELAEHFFRLWDLGLIECSAGGLPLAADIMLARLQFVRSLDWPPPNDQTLVYRLTLSGGELWEYYSSPDWNNFVSSGTSPEPNEWILAASRRRHVELLQACWYRHPAPIEGTESWMVSQPWKATYWKSLPIGYQLNFRYATLDRSPRECGSDSDEACQQLEQIRLAWRKTFEDVCRDHFG